MPSPAPAAPSVMRLAALLVRFRVRHAWNALARSPRAKSARALGVFAVLVPAAYLGLFATSFRTLTAMAPRSVQAAALAIVCGVIVLASFAGKVASGEAVLAGSSENAFYLTRPLGLPRLVVARSLSGAATDLFDALFLFPVLAAAAWTYGLGAAGWALAGVISVVMQVALVSAAQATQIALVHVVPPRRRRGLWTALGLASAASIALLWMAATAFLRRPQALIDQLAPVADRLLATPLVLIPAPVLAAAAGARVTAVVLALALALASAATIALAALVARVASRRGWEDAAAPWAEPAPGAVGAPRRAGRPLSVVGKDLRALTRDRARLVGLVAMPIIFVGVQVFGAAGWTATTASPRRIGMLAFSLAAYLATIGPLGHMQAERQAFWILRSVPVPLGRLLAQKALAWMVLVVALAASAFVFLAVFAGGLREQLGELAATGALVVMGAASVSWLAVALGSEAADWSRPTRPAIPLGTAYTFLLVAGLWNVVLVERGEILARALGLYAAAIALGWVTGVERARDSFDPEAADRRALTPADGVSAAILMFLGARAVVLGATATGDATALVLAWVPAVWGGLVAGIAGLASWQRDPRARPRASVLMALALALTGAVFLRAITGADLVAWAGPVPLPLLVGVLAEEIVFRRVLQGALERREGGAYRAMGVAFAIGVAAAVGPLTPDLVAQQAIAAALRARTGRVLPGVVARVLALV